MTFRCNDRRRTKGRNRPRTRSVSVAVSAALSIVLIGGAATAAHADDMSTAPPAVSPPERVLPISGPAAASERHLDAQQPASPSRVALPIERPGLSGHFTGVLDSELGAPVTVGTGITWTAELTNTGDVELLTINGVDFSLTPGETTSNFSWKKQVTQADLDAGSVGFSWNYDATTVSGTRYTSPAITGTLALPRPPEKPALTGQFTGRFENAGAPVTVGTWITWTTDLTNTGDVALRRINDVGLDLAPGQAAPVLKVRTQVTQADLDSGTIGVSRTFTAITPNGTRYTTPAITGTLSVPARTPAG